MPYARIQRRTSPATICAIIVAALLAIAFIVGILAPKNADAAERGKCAATNVAAKANKKSPEPAPKKEEKPVITMILLHVSAAPGQTIPSAPSDTAAATKRESGLVEEHVRMRLVANNE